MTKCWKIPGPPLRMACAHFNQTTTAPFKLSFSMGLVRYNGRSTESFLNELDQKMYAEKKAYHQEHPR